jgi:cobalt-zinc-cadmium efflux system membrane fusion protein
MLRRLPPWCKRLVSVTLGVVGVGAAVLIASWYLRPSQSQAATERRAAEPRGRIEQVAPGTLQIPADVAQSLGVKTAPAKPAGESRRLAPLNGSLALDPDHLAHVHSRFAGEVVEVATLANPGDQDAPMSASETMRT